MHDMILSIEIKRNNNMLAQTQLHYIEKVLKTFGHFGLKSIPTSFDSNKRLVRHTSRHKSL